MRRDIVLMFPRLFLIVVWANAYRLERTSCDINYFFRRDRLRVIVISTFSTLLFVKFKYLLKYTCVVYFIYPRQFWAQMYKIIK